MPFQFADPDFCVVESITHQHIVAEKNDQSNCQPGRFVPHPVVESTNFFRNFFGCGKHVQIPFWHKITRIAYFQKRKEGDFQLAEIALFYFMSKVYWLK